MFEELFLRKKPNPEKLEEYGFARRDDDWIYNTGILKSVFRLSVTINNTGVVDTDLTETETGEPYVLYKTNAAGSYVGEIRAAVEALLAEIADHCFESAVFKSRQADIAIQHIRETYGDELEFLWTKFPDNAVWRRKDNRKWYGALLTVTGRKIGLPTDKLLEIIDLRMEPSQKETVLSRQNYYPGWHMNKNSWYTLVLDGSVSDDELKMRINESYALAGK